MLRHRSLDAGEVQSVIIAPDFPPRVRPAALICDFAGVLYDDSEWPRWLSRLLNRVAVACDSKRLFAVWDSEYLDLVHSGARPFHEAFGSLLRHFSLTAGQIDEIAAASRLRRQQLAEYARPYPGVAAALRQLAAEGATLALLADTEHTAPTVALQAERMGMEGVFSVVLSSADLKSAKPRPRGYVEALDRLQASPDQAAFVGRRASHLATAARLGLGTFALNYDSDAAADFHLRRFDELIAILHQWPASAAA